MARTTRFTTAQVLKNSGVLGWPVPDPHCYNTGERGHTC